MKGEIAHFERTGPRAGSSKREGNSRERIGVDAGAGNEDAQNPIEIRMADPDNGETKHLADNTDKTSPKFAATAEQVRAAPRSRTPDEEMRQDEEAAAQRKAAEDEGTGPLLESSTDAGGGHARATSSFSLSPSLPPSPSHTSTNNKVTSYILPNTLVPFRATVARKGTRVWGTVAGMTSTRWCLKG